MAAKCYGVSPLNRKSFSLPDPEMQQSMAPMKFGGFSNLFELSVSVPNSRVVSIKEYRSDCEVFYIESKNYA